MTTISSTYRIQFHKEFDFDQAVQVLPYLRQLGLSHIYASPYLQAVPGSTHGYDVVDHSAVNEDLGGEKAHQWFCRGLNRNGLGQILDIVPNHMAIAGHRNRWWWDVLENGPSSRYASYFDVDWRFNERENTILVPVLGDHYGRVVENREIRLERKAGAFIFRYYEHVFPVDPRTLPSILVRAAESSDSPDLGFIAGALENLPAATATDRISTKRRHRDKEVLKKMLTELLEQQPVVRRAVDEQVTQLNSDPDRLDFILNRQNYRPAFWKIARTDLGYRRFFDINNLVGLRVEDDEVFDETHERIVQWLSDGTIGGVRIDHPDGLRDPEAYFRRLRSTAPVAWIVGEKILHFGESLRPNWPIDGTTGYEFLNLALRTMMNSGAEQKLNEFWQDFSGSTQSYEQLLKETKQQVLRELLGSDLNRLTSLAQVICERQRLYRDFSREEIHRALSEILISFPVYRTYMRPGEAGPEEQDLRIIKETVSEAIRNADYLDPKLFEFIGSVLQLQHTGAEETELVARIQQLSPPVMAKGAEDTAFYRYNRFVALNEVGGDPAEFSASLAEFHKQMQDRSRTRPKTMLTSSTHDTKRSEDVRTRLAVLSEIPDEWINLVQALSEAGRAFTENGYPDRSTEYLIYQTLVGCYPLTESRALSYLEKACREAKVHTTWTSVNEHYENAVKNYTTRIMADPEIAELLRSFNEKIDRSGKINSLSLALIKFTAPGIPDLYQGCELWDYSLVDPDNRRPVDFTLRQSLLDRIVTESPEEIMSGMQQGLPKLWVTHQALSLRHRQPDLFLAPDSYRPLEVRGTRKDFLIGYLRSDKIAVLAPRFPVALADNWENTTVTLPPGRWNSLLSREIVSGGEITMAKLTARFPVCLLILEKEDV